MLQCAITVWMLHHIVFLLHKTICSNAFLMGWIAVLLLLSSYYRFDKVKRWLICWGVHIALFFKDFVWWYFCTKSFYGLRNNLVRHKYSLKFVKSKTSYVKSYFWYTNNPSSIFVKIYVEYKRNTCIIWAVHKIRQNLFGHFWYPPSQCRNFDPELTNSYLLISCNIGIWDPSPTFIYFRGYVYSRV